MDSSWRLLWAVIREIFEGPTNHLIFKRSSKEQNVMNPYKHVFINPALEYFHHSRLHRVRDVNTSLNESCWCIDTMLMNSLVFSIHRQYSTNFETIHASKPACCFQVPQKSHRREEKILVFAELTNWQNEVENIWNSPGVLNFGTTTTGDDHLELAFLLMYPILSSTFICSIIHFPWSATYLRGFHLLCVASVSKWILNAVTLSGPTPWDFRYVSIQNPTPWDFACEQVYFFQLS